MKRDLPLHQVRHVPGRKRAAPEQPASDYPAGYFTELIRAHNWPPRFESQYQRTREVEQSEYSRVNREAQVAAGNTGTILGISPKSDARLKASSAPGYMR
jgi:hypothetical protein